jgi:hypothetical protein
MKEEQFEEKFDRMTAAQQNQSEKYFSEGSLWCGLILYEDEE